MDEVTIFCDGASRGNPGEAGIGYVIAGGDGTVLKEGSDYLGQATNNVAEYTALVRALQDSLKLGVSRVKVCSDSQLMVRQIKGEYKVKSPGLAPLFNQVIRLISRFESFDIEHIPRGENKQADQLANKGIDDLLTK